jgi:DNA-binding transcriptional LysR family regulator
MELMQLEMFVAMVEERSVRGAAERVFRTQPAVSIAIRKLEEEMSAPLFDRSKRCEYRLTPVGEALYNYAARLLSLRDEALSAVADLSNLRTGRLRVGANESISMHLVPQLVEAFLKDHPEIRIELCCESSARLVTELRDRRLDLALLSFEPAEPDLESQFMMTDELVLITNPKHRFAAQAHILIEDLVQQSVFVMDVSSAWHKRMMEAFIQFKTAFHLTVENAPIETIKKMVSRGLGIGFVPLMCVREEQARGELAVVAIEGFRQERSLYVVRRRAVQSHAAKEFVEVAVSFGERAQAVGRLTGTEPVKSAPSAGESGRKIAMVKRRA